MEEKKSCETKYTIELDCPPGNPRPGDLLPAVLQDTGVVIDPEKTVGRFFGNWTWQVPPDQSEQYEKQRKLIADRIKSLYERGFIRYGSW
jgi:hypothetical protein